MFSSREAYKNELTKLAYEYKDIVAIEADLGGKNHIFEKNHPERFFNLGIAEMASLDICSGLAVKGYKPYFSTFAPFVALRCAESIKLSLSYMKHNINIIASYGGVSGGWFGTTHHCLEDMSILTTLPNIRIACPHGEEEVRRVIRDSYHSDTPYYIRLYRNDKFQSLVNKGNKGYIIDGEFDNKKNITLLSIGEISTEMSIEAKKKFNINHVHLIYVDKSSIVSMKKELSEIMENQRIITVEEHREIGSVSNLLKSEFPNQSIISFTPNDLYPHNGGSHTDILRELEFSQEILDNLIEKEMNA